MVPRYHCCQLEETDRTQKSYSHAVCVYSEVKTQFALMRAGGRISAYAPVLPHKTSVRKPHTPNSWLKPKGKHCHFIKLNTAGTLSTHTVILITDNERFECKLPKAGFQPGRCVSLQHKVLLPVRTYFRRALPSASWGHLLLLPPSGLSEEAMHMH